MVGGALTHLCRACLMPSDLLFSTYIRRHFRILSVNREKPYCLQKLPLRKRLTTKSGSASDDVRIEYWHGHPVISLILPSRNERCNFTLSPLISTVGQFLNDLKAEDVGIDTTVIHGPDDAKVASSTRIAHLLLGNFKITINNITYDVKPPVMDKVSVANIAWSADVRQLVMLLYNNLNADDCCMQRKQEALERLENLKFKLEPLAQMKQELEKKANFHTNLVIWGGLAYMSAQFGVLARLTWWEYSWDIMEPVTYFITYGTAILLYGYFILTKQEYIYPDARDRQFLRLLHKAAHKSNFDVSTYNSLCEQIGQAEEDLRRLRGTTVSSHENAAQQYRN